MLQKQTVENSTFELLKELQNETELINTRLVGGTSLALQIGHRVSDDLDLFSYEKFNVETILELLQEKYNFIPRITNPNTIIGEINNVKIDIIYHPFKWLEPPVEIENIRLASLKDISAMKMHAIINSGKRPKDFVDIAFLGNIFSYDQIKQYLIDKYPRYDPIMADRALTYFGDISEQLIPLIKMTGQKLDFEKIKKRLLQMGNNPYKIFDESPLQTYSKNKTEVHTKNNYKRKIK